MGSKARAREDVRPVKNLLPHKQQAPTMSSPLKSRASQKFRANHPYQHQMFADLVKSAKLTNKSKFMFQREDEEMNSEMSNMVRNQEIVQLRPEDLPHCKLRKRSLKLKSVSWRKSLCDICPSTEISQQKFTNLHRQQTSAHGDKNLSGLEQLNTGSSDSSLPELNTCQEYLPLVCTASCQNLPSYSVISELPSLESSPGEYSYPESLSHESSSPGSSSSESSSPSRTISLSKTVGCLKFSFFTTCDSNIERQW